MADRFSRSWELIKYSAAVLKTDSELLVFPFFSSIAAIIVLASFAPLFIEPPQTEQDTYYFVVLGGLYLAEYFVIIFFNSALVGAAMIRMRGGNPGIADGLRIAWSRFWQIFGYAMMAATVGVLLRVVGQRLGFVGRILVGLTGIAWTVATYLVVPVLVSRNVGPVDAVKESASLLRKTWGENLISSAGLGMVFYLVYVLLFGLVSFLAYAAAGAGNTELAIGIAAVGVLAAILIGLFQAALQGIISAALYQYATDGPSDKSLNNGRPGAGIPPEALSRAFAPK
jgi:hypothetical protein